MIPLCVKLLILVGVTGEQMEAPFPTLPWFPFALSSVTWCPFDLLIFAFPKKKCLAFTSPFFFFGLEHMILSSVSHVYTEVGWLGLQPSW